MRHYTFRYINGGSAPYQTLDAKDDRAFYTKLKDFLGNMKRLVPGSITYQESGRVADPVGGTTTCQFKPSIVVAGKELPYHTILVGGA